MLIQTDRHTDTQTHRHTTRGPGHNSGADGGSEVHVARKSDAQEEQDDQEEDEEARQVHTPIR